MAFGTCLIPGMTIEPSNSSCSPPLCSVLYARLYRGVCSELISNAVVGSFTARVNRGKEPYVFGVELPVPNLVGVRLVRVGIGTACEANCVVSAFDELKSTDEGVASLRGLPTRDSTK